MKSGKFINVLGFFYWNNNNSNWSDNIQYYVMLANVILSTISQKTMQGCYQILSTILLK